MVMKRRHKVWHSRSVKAFFTVFVLYINQLLGSVHA